jgi:hypothetical protein
MGYGRQSRTEEGLQERGDGMEGGEGGETWGKRGYKLYYRKEMDKKKSEVGRKEEGEGVNRVFT